MAQNYIPTTDAALDAWSANFSTKLTASPGTYGLMASDATVVAGVVTSWHTAYLASVAPATRTPVTVAVKDTAKLSMLDIVRPYAVQVSLNAGVLPSDKVALGVNPRTTGPTPVGAPTSSPVVSLIGGTFLQHLLRYRDQNAPATSRAKPVGVTQLQLYGAVSATVVSDPSTLPLVGVFTRVPVTVTWDSSARGKTAYYAARWQTRTGLVGPWSDILALVVM